MERMKWILAMLALAVASQGMAQDPGEIHGKVVDPDGEPVLYAIVRATQGGAVHGAETDEQGRFILKPLPPGVYDLEIQGGGLNPLSIDGVRVDPGLIRRMGTLALEPTRLGTVTVTAKRWEEPLIRPDDPARMVITQSQIRKNAVRKDLVKLVYSMTPGVTRNPNNDELYFRGSRAGSMAYYVDGVKVTGSNPGIPSEAINSISVYTGGLPAKYGDVTGGVVAIETKSYFDLYQQRNRRR